MPVILIIEFIQHKVKSMICSRPKHSAIAILIVGAVLISFSGVWVETAHVSPTVPGNGMEGSCLFCHVFFDDSICDRFF